MTDILDTPWLIIFDNAEDPSLILDYWPRSKWGAILATTLDSIFADPAYFGNGRELLQLDVDSSIQFLLSSLNLPGTQSELAREIVQQVGCLPVAIRACISQIRAADCSLYDYNKEWNDPRSIINQSRVQYVDSKSARYDKGLPDLIAKSLRDLNQDARALVNIISLMDVEHIPKEMFQNQSLHAKLPFLRHLSGLIIDLTRSSLIGKETDSLDSQRYHIHRVFKEFIQMQMGPNDCQIAFNSAALVLDEQIVGKGLSPDSAAKKFSANKFYFQHVESLWRFYRSEVERSRADSSVQRLLPSPAFIRALRKMSW